MSAGCCSSASPTRRWRPPTRTTGRCCKARDAQLEAIEADLPSWYDAPPFAEAVHRLSAYRGVTRLGALTLASEVGDWRRFPRAAAFYGFCGLVPSEYSSGGSTWRGHITKCGNAHLRAQLVEFTVGVLAGERGWLEVGDRRLVRGWEWAGVAAVLGLTGLAAGALATDRLDAVAGGLAWPSAAFAGLDGLGAVALSLWLVAWFRRRWDRPGPLVQRAGRGSYAVYVLHPPVLVLLSMLARPCR